MFLQDHIDSFVKFLRFERRYSAHTLTAYTNDLSDFFDYAAIQYEITDPAVVSHKMVRSWVVGLVNQGLKPRSVNRKVSSLRAFFRFLVKKEILKANPMTKVTGMKTPARLPVFADQKDMHHLLHEINFPEGFSGFRDKLVLETFYATGIRLSELVNLQVSSIDWSNSQLKVLGKGNKERLIPLHPEQLQRLKEYMLDRKKRSDTTFLFVTDQGNKLYDKWVYRKVTAYLGAVTTLKKKSPHVLRHSFATHLMNEGAELNAVKELLGHKSLAATQVYTHNTIQKLKDIHKQAHPKS
jgi:integrase/recombinase XerC